MAKTVYYIDLNAPDSLPVEEVFKILFSNKFVFTSARCKNLNEMESMWPRWREWRCLVFNDEINCCMVVHANSYIPIRDFIVIITLDELLQLPEFK